MYEHGVYRPGTRGQEMSPLLLDFPSNQLEVSLGKPAYRTGRPPSLPSLPCRMNFLELSPRLADNVTPMAFHSHPRGP